MSGNIDKTNPFQKPPFEYKLAKDNRIIIFWHKKHIKTIIEKDSVISSESNW